MIGFGRAKVMNAVGPMPGRTFTRGDVLISRQSRFMLIGIAPAGAIPIK
jgi:hypothetical protein